MQTLQVTRLWRDERGGGTIFGLLWFALTVGICGLAVDVTDGFRSQTMLQATADSAALAAVIDLPDKTAAVTTAIDYAEQNMEPGTNGNGSVLLAQDVTPGVWNATNRTFTPAASVPSTTPLDAVHVIVHRGAANANPVATNFLRIIGRDDWNVKAQAIAQRFIPECLNDGLIARGSVDLSSNNSFVNRICLHGQKGVDMQSNNYFEKGVSVSMPNLDMLDAQSANIGLQDALREDILDPRMVNHLEEIMDSYLDPPTSKWLPDYITDPSLPTINLSVSHFNWNDVLPNRVHYIECKNAQQLLTIDIDLTNVLIVADCKILIGSGVTLSNVSLSSRAESSLNATGNQDKLRQGASITTAANVQLGKADFCQPGGGVQLFSNNAMLFSSTTTFDGVQIVAGGDVELGARDMGIRGISVQSGRNIYMTSNNEFGLCSGGAPNLFTVDYYRLVL